MYNKRILIADDDRNFLDIYTYIFTRQKELGLSSEKEIPEEYFSVETFPDGKYLFEYFKGEYEKNSKFPLCILDMKMPRMDGLETAEEIRKIDSEVIIILVTGYDVSLIKIKENLKKDIYYVKKPFNKEELYCLVESLVKGWNKNQRLKESEEKYRNIFESFSDVYYRTDMDGIIKVMSPSITIHSGYLPEELIERSIKELYFKPSDRDILLKKLYNTGFLRNYELKLKRKDGSLIDVSVNKRILWSNDGTPLAIEGIMRDITERKKAEKEKRKLERQLREKQKLEAIGVLAGGIAHDFNNILSAVIGYTYLALNYIPEQSGARENLQYVLDASYHATDLVKQILTFSRQGEQEKTPVNLSLIVKDVLKLLRATIPSTIAIRKKIDNESKIMADITQIHQVLMNLCTNAAHAMKENGGELEVSLSDVYMEKNTGPEPSLKPGTYVKLTVSDTGHGMSEEIMEHIFEPYFTTKEKGEGTGLGLAVVHGIVESHGGEISVTSKEGKGTIFYVYFPKIEAETGIEEENTSPLMRGSERILFVEDEKYLLNMAQKTLENLGYKVTATGESPEALEIFKKNPENFDLVITNETMPGLRGNELSKKILSIRPDIPVILCTGYSNIINEEIAKAMGIKEFFLKPFDIKKVSKIIRKLLKKNVE